MFLNILLILVTEETSHVVISSLNVVLFYGVSLNGDLYEVHPSIRRQRQRYISDRTSAVQVRGGHCERRPPHRDLGGPDARAHRRHPIAGPLPDPAGA